MLSGWPFSPLTPCDESMVIPRLVAPMFAALAQAGLSFRTGIKMIVHHSAVRPGGAQC